MLATLEAVVVMFYSACGRQKASAHPHPAPVVELAPVVQKNIPIYGNWVGTPEGYLTAKISPQVSGNLIRQDYQEGDRVKKGQVLFEIDPKNLPGRP